jgi:hypothetical protein
MRIAYLILAHHQPQHLGALIERLDDGNARFFIHIDQKSDILPFRNAIRSERAIFLNERLPIEWGGWNMVQATLDLLRRAHHQSPSTYYQLLSGNCYPIKSNQDIAGKLSSGNFNYITLNDEMKPGSRFYSRLFYRQSDQELISIFKRRPSFAKLNVPRYLGRLITSVRRQQDRLMGRTLPAGMRPYKGGQWWCLTHDCARYVLDYANANPRFVQFFRSTYVPDESFFHTIIANSEFAHTLSPCRARKVTSGNHHVRWRRVGVSNKPRVLTERDFDELMASEACFARKFSEKRSGQLIRLLRERIG